MTGSWSHSHSEALENTSATESGRSAGKKENCKNKMVVGGGQKPTRRPGVKLTRIVMEHGGIESEWEPFGVESGRGELAGANSTMCATAH